MAPEEVAVIDLDPGGEQEGIWYLAHLKGEIAGGTASSSEDHRTVEAESYRIETAIARNDHFSASTRLKFKAVAEGDRVVKFGLLPYLRVTRVSADGRDTTFIQEPVREDGSLYAVMPQPMPRGSSHELLIEYAGDKVVRKEGGGNFAVGARESWYPAVNSFRDHALYGMFSRFPSSTRWWAWASWSRNGPRRTSRAANGTPRFPCRWRVSTTENSKRPSRSRTK
jgi:hypothetical protein